MEKNRIFIIIGAVIICTVAIIIVNKDRLFTKSSNESDTQTETETLGDLNINATEDDLYEQGYDLSIDGPIYAEDTDTSAVKNNTVVYQNLELVYDLFTLQALADITDETYKYLNMHGYSETQKLTIIEESIIYEKSYPYFEAEAENLENKILEVRYHLDTQTFEFNIREK